MGSSAFLAETIPGVPDQLTGPVAALVLAILVIVGLGRFTLMLWKEHLKADQDDRDQRDRAMAISEAQVTATNRLADGQQALSVELAAFRKELATFRTYMADRRRRGDS